MLLMKTLQCRFLHLIHILMHGLILMMVHEMVLHFIEMLDVQDLV